MRRKPNALVPFEQSILEAATRLKEEGFEEFYGFQIAKEIAGFKKAKHLVGFGTLYRALDRLAKFGLLTRRWESTPEMQEENRPKRRYYKLAVGLLGNCRVDIININGIGVDNSDMED